MTQGSWRIEEPAPEDEVTVDHAPTLVTLHYLRREVRRRWRTCVAASLLGLLAGAGFSYLVPAPSEATVTLLLAHDTATDPALAMATDVSLLRTRAVAGSVVEAVDLSMTPEDFQRSVRVVPETSDVLVLTLPGTGADDARRRAQVLADTYLTFRRDQLMSQADATVARYEQRVASLQEQVEVLTEQYDRLAAAGPESSQEASAVLTERSQHNAEILRLQQLEEDTLLKASSVVAASHVLDPPGLVPRSGKRRTVLVSASGFVAGTAAGVGLVVFLALTSDRLRRREDVSLALGVPVRVSVPRGGGTQAVSHALASALLQGKRHPVRLAIVATDEGAAALADIARALSERMESQGHALFLVDLTTDGSLASLRRDDAEILRPEGVPQLARGPLGNDRQGLRDLPETGPVRQAHDAADSVVVFTQVDPALGADELATWVTRVVYLVNAGGSSAERLRSIADLVQSAKLSADFAVLLDADPHDESTGFPNGLGQASDERRGGRR
jgi:capsular polysaccharide biosynthesis protein